MIDFLRIYNRVRRDRERLRAQTLEQARIIRQLTRERDAARADANLLIRLVPDRAEAWKWIEERRQIASLPQIVKRK